MSRQLTHRAQWRQVSRLLHNEIARLEVAVENEDVMSAVSTQTWLKLERHFNEDCPEARILRPEYEKLQLLDAVLLTTFGSPGEPLSLPDFSP